MNNTEKATWKNRINNLSPDNQLDLAVIFLDTFKSIDYTNELYQDYELFKSYNVIIAQLEESLKGEKDAKLIKSIIDNFTKLKCEYQNEVIKSVGNRIGQLLEYQELLEKYDECKKEGHVFDKENDGWQEKIILEVEDGIQLFDHIDSRVEKKVWERTCKRCGYHEISKVNKDNQNKKVFTKDNK